MYGDTYPIEPRPQPVFGAAIKTAVGELIGLAIAFGAPITDAQQTAVLGVTVSVGTLVGLYLAWRASRKVTPLSSPLDEAGNRLVAYRSGV